MCPKNGTIFMLRVPRMGLLFLDFAFYIWYMFILAMLKVPPRRVYGVCSLY